MKNTTPSCHQITEYVTGCWSIPPLFIASQVREIQRILDGWSIKVSHKELHNAIAREQRFPGHQEINTGIKMVYQDYVWVHQHRMFSLADMLQNELEGLGIWDINEFLFLCLYHDAPEWISAVGDLPTPVKESFSPIMRSIHNYYEEQLINIVTNHILDTQITWFSNSQMFNLSHESDEKQTLRAQMLSYQDKFDACMICIHEIQAGNINFFLDKLKWYAGFFNDVSIWKRLPLIRNLIPSLDSSWLLQEIYNPSKIVLETSDIVMWENKDQKSRNKIIDTMGSYQLWKEATRRIDSVQVWNTIMTWEEVLTKPRGSVLLT